jgi:hypothetical protein
MKYLGSMPLLFLVNTLYAQTDKPFIKLAEPTKADINTKTNGKFIVDSTSKNCNMLPLA